MSIEDGLAEGDWDGWKRLTDRLGSAKSSWSGTIFRHQPGDHARGIREGVANSVLIKLNQIGTLSETLEAVDMAHEAGYTAVIPTGRARPRTPPSPIWRSPSIRARSRPARPPELTVSRSTTNFFESKRSSMTPLFFLAWRH